jgi:RNA polymerase sigma-70 factor (ECF subfamily)
MKTEKDQFLELILENRKIIYKVCHAYCRDPEDRKDLEQEIILQLWHSSDRYDDQFRLSTWIYRIAFNVAISFRRKESNRKKRISSVDQDIIERTTGEPESTDLDADINQLYQFINQLDELSRALTLLYLDDHPYKEIATTLGVSESNVATKISCIRQRLRKVFETESK